MGSDAVNTLFHRAVEHHSRGQLLDALALYDEILRLDPKAAAAHCNRGIALQSLGRFDEAIRSYDCALELQPNFAEIYANKANALHESGQSIEALPNYDKALALKPGLAEAHHNKGKALQALKRLSEAVECYSRATRLKADYADAFCNMGNALQELQRFNEAVQSYDRAIALKPDFAEAHTGRGIAFMNLQRPNDALASYDRAIAIQPSLGEAYYNKAYALLTLRRLEDALDNYDRAIALKLNCAEAHANRGWALRELGRLSQAVDSFNKAIALKPDCVEAHNNLGATLKAQGKLAEAVESYGRALALKPDYAEANSGLLMTLHYSEDFSNADILAAAKRFAARFENPAAAKAFANDPTPGRRLRIGYVSGDFHSHPVGYFLDRVLPSHDRSAVEVFCYSNSAARDAMTDRLRGAADHWRSIIAVSDADSANLVQQDEIDILVDLSGHTAMHRLPLFALRPAPVQVSWLGYFGTTGLTAIDYVLVDHQIVPEGDERYFSEKIWRLPGCYLCYAPHSLDVTVGSPPMASNGFVTFGCFNNRAKITQPTIELWARVLSNVPGSRLFLKTKSFNDAAVCQELRDQFAGHGVAADRLLLEGSSRLAEALSAYNRVDIALDPFPFGGCTTTAESLWMGVPVVTPRGDRWVGRMSASILRAIGHPELVAESLDDYVEIAAGLVADLPRLTRLRAGLRSQLENSPFCDGPGFTRGLEATYRAMWQAWCDSATPSTTPPR